MARGAIMIGFIVLLGAGLAQAVMIRHDVPEKKYLELAARPEFQSGLLTMLDPRDNYTGVLIGSRHVLTVGHPIVGYLPDRESSGSVAMKVRFQEKDYDAEYAYLHPQYDRVAHHGGADLAIIRLKQPGITSAKPSTIWFGGVALGDRFIGVGLGKSGTGKDRDEPKPIGTFRGYENTIDYLFGEEGLRHFRSDFDNGTVDYNTLARVLYEKKNLEIKGKSSKTPLPLEGTTAAGDSGSGVWVKRDKKYHLAGIASYRYFSMYGGQAGYVNLSHPANVKWLREVAMVEDFALEGIEADK